MKITTKVTVTADGSFWPITEKLMERNLKRFGGWVRTIAKRSIKKRKMGGDEDYADPGKPPYSKTGKLRDFLRYAWDDSTKSVVVGAIKLNSRNNAPDALEFGGKALIQTGTGPSRHTEEVYIRARPYMRPALEIALTKLPRIFKDSLSSFSFDVSVD